MFIEELSYPLDHILKGVGPEFLKVFSRMGLVDLSQFLQYYPASYEDRRKIVSLSEISDTKNISCIITVNSHNFFNFRGEKVCKVNISDNSSQAFLLCYGRSFLTKTLIIGQRFYLYGSFERKHNQLQSSRFDVEPFSEFPENFGKLLPIYGLSKSLAQNKVRNFMKQALEFCPASLEYLVPAEYIEKYGGFSLKKQCLEAIHFCTDWKSYEKAKISLVLEEFFTFYSSLLWKKQELFVYKRDKKEIPRQYLNEVKRQVPFSLTRDQCGSLEKILDNLEKEVPMRHLLQGDVGTGKTLVAILSTCPILELAKQVVFMAPTELLARQHLLNVERFLEPLGIKVSFLTSNISTKQRKQTLVSIMDGSSLFIVGTHSVFSADAIYHNLSYVIIDEQHRFGVVQRERILAKGKGIDLLLMSATPIPRTLALSIFGDLDCSKLGEYPSGRLPIKTHLVCTKNLGKVHSFVLKEIAEKHQVYYVYPYIEQTEKADISDAMTMFTQFKEIIFKQYNVGIIHSRLSEQEIKNTMDLFVKGQVDILVATSIIEVGVDVPNATVIVIEGAERFGLSALHQLRGRVGRGSQQSYCFLVYNKLSEDSKFRLKTIYETIDGFKIADEDLKLRGPGDLSGYQQSGIPRFKIANLMQDMDLFLEMKEASQKVLNNAEKYQKILDHVKNRLVKIARE